MPGRTGAPAAPQAKATRQPQAKQPPPNEVAVERPKTFNKIRCAGDVVLLSSLVPDPNNARLHPERNLEAIKDSLAFYGQMEPLVVRQQNRMIAAGNGRHAAMLAMGWTKCAVTVQPMTDAEFHGFALADNRTAELAQWDYQVVTRLEKLLQEQNHAVVGWTLEDLTVLRENDFDLVAPDGESAQTWQELWQGMPEFIQEDQTSFKSIVVHFRNEEDFLDFLAKVGQAPGDVRQRSIWHPRAEIGRFADKRYVV